MHDNLHNQRGSALLYTVLVMAVIINVIIIVSHVVVLDVRQSTNTDQSLRAYYHAEAGAEKALYHYRKDMTKPVTGDCGITGSVCALTVTKDSMTTVNSNLSANDTLEFVWDAGPSGIQSMTASWLGATTWLEVTLMPWDPTSMTWQDDQVNKLLLSGGAGTVNAFTPANQYKVRVKALYGTATRLALKFYTGNNGTGTLIAVPKSVTFDAVADSGSASQRVTVTIPPAAPLMGLFDYVLFSEKAIVK